MATVSSTIELVDKMSSKLNEIETNVNSMKDALKSVSGEQSSIDKFSWKTFLSNAEKAGSKIKKIGEEMTLALTTPSLLLGKEMYGNAVDYETAFVGMQKTVEGTTEQYEQLKQTALELSETTPMNYVDLMGIAQTGGNLGVAIDDMETFMQSYARLQYATDQHISGESGAQDVASFLNITEGGVANIERFGSSIVHLGNNFNATEDQIIAMGNRMASAAHLAGASTPEILGMATAFTSVGINAEAGGSAASKLFKQMQLAAEVGGTAQQKLASVGKNFETALDFSNALDSMKKADLADLAKSMGMTTDAVQSMADNWVLMEQFAQVSGKTTDQFIEDWGTNAVGAMADFFTGLSGLGDQGGESILATLDKMGLTEIRESNLIAAMASRPELFSSAVQEATDAYQKNTAMVEEFNKQMDTTASKNEMLKNKMENTTANLGENLVQMLQPALDKVNELITAFNSLSETDQDKLLTTFAVFAVGGPIVTAVGATVEMIGKIGTGITKAKTALTGIMGKGGLSAILTNPVTWGVAAGGALLLFIEYLDSIPTKFEELAKGATDIPITLDEGAYQETISKIQEVQQALNDLKPGEVRTEYENMSAAVTYGFGTQDMFASALGYETAKTEANISQVASDYAEKMNDAQARIAKAAGKGDTAAAQAAKQEFEGLRNAYDSELVSIKSDYTKQISNLFNGMASQYPEAASALVDAAKKYDVMRMFYEASQISYYNDDGSYNAAAEQQVESYNRALAKAAWDSGFFADQFGGFSNFDTFYESFGSGTLGNISSYMEDFQNQVMQEMNNHLQTLSENPMLTTWLSSMLADPTITENMDVTQLNGALEGIFKLLDYQQAFKAAGDKPSEWGKYVSEGLGQGITDSASAATDAGSNLGTDTINNIKAALGVASPSIFMIEAGLNVDEGLMQGILSGEGMVVAAVTAIGNRVVAVAKGILSSAAGSSIGLNFAAGLAAGIRSGASSVISAATDVANAGLNAANSTLGIASPSKETYWQGEMMVAGYRNALMDGSSRINRTVSKVVGDSGNEWNQGVWAIIQGFNKREAQMWNDELNDVEDKITVSDSDLKKIRSLAEREVINRFTTAEIKVEMNNTNTINSDMDVDGIISRLEDKVAERLEAVAEGVYT